MKARTVLREDHLISFINELYDGDLHAKRVLSLAHGTLGVLTSASLAVHAIGQGLAHARGTLSKHGVKQVDRLLSNRAIELDGFFSHWVPHVIGAREEIVVALDWTSFARDGHDTLMLSMLTEHGRATGVMWETVWTATLKDNRNRRYLTHMPPFVQRRACQPGGRPHTVRGRTAVSVLEGGARGGEGDGGRGPRVRRL